jgi:hypothetical protein
MHKQLTLLITIVLIAIFGMSLRAQDTVSFDFFTESGGYAFDFTPNGQFLAVVRYEYPEVRNRETTRQTIINVYQVSDFSLVATYDISDEPVELLVISHDRRFIAFVQVGGLYVLDTTTGETVQRTYNFLEFEELEFNPVNHLLAYVFGRGITVFDALNPDVQYDLIDSVYGGGITSLAWSPDGRYLANGVYRAGSDTFDVLLWDVPTLQNPLEEVPTFAFLGAEPNHVAWRDANTLAAFGETGIMIYDLPTRSLIVFIPSPSGVVWYEGTWSPEGDRLFASGGNGQAPIMQIWDVSNLPDYQSIFYREGTSSTDVSWTDFGLFYSTNGLYRDGEALVPQLTATVQGTPVMPSFLTPTATPVGFVASPHPSRTPVTPTATPTPTERPALPDNLLLNGGFENPRAKPESAIYWSGTGLTSEDGRVCNDTPVAGECIFRFSSVSPTSSLRSILQRYFPLGLMAGDRLTLSGQFSGDDLVSGGGAYLRVLYGDGSITSVSLAIPSGTFGYTTLTGELIVENKPLVQADISIELPGESTGVLRVDDMRLSVTDYRLVTPQAPLPTATPTPTATP